MLKSENYFMDKVEHSTGRHNCAEGWVSGAQGRCSSPLIFRDDFDHSDNVSIELRQVLSWNPILLMNRGADGFDFMPPQKLRADLKASHESSPRPAFGVPIAGDLCGVFFVEDGIENRLMRQSRREFPITAASDQIQLFLPD